MYHYLSQNLHYDIGIRLFECILIKNKWRIGNMYIKWLLFVFIERINW